MTLKSFLLGSAAAFAVVGGAEAADLSVAEPVEFVRICEAFGTGYWYIPGSDTCLKISGDVEFDVNIHDLSVNAYSTHSSNWDFVTNAGLNFTAKSMTEFGELVAFAALKGTYNMASSATAAIGTNTGWYLDGAWLRIGALQVGHFGSPFNPDSSFMDDFGINAVIKSTLADNNKIQLSWAAAGFGLALGIEDPRETWGTSLPASWSMPLITGAITASQANWSGKLSAGAVQVSGGTSWGVDGQITFNLDTIAAGDALRLNAAYGDNPFIGGALPTVPYSPANNGWSAFASFRHMWTSTARTDFDFAYLQPSGGGATTWKAGVDLVWLPVAGFKAKAAVTWSQTAGSSGSWMGQVALRRDW